MLTTRCYLWPYLVATIHRMDDAGRLAELAALGARLAAAVSADDFQAAGRFPAGAGLAGRFEPDSLRVGGRLIASPLPRLVVEVQPPVDAAAVCDALGIDRPVAVSSDVHQLHWEVLVAGADLPDPYAARIAVHPFAVGRWQVIADLVGRPVGPLPDRVAGASPAYDLPGREAQVHRLRITRHTPRADLVRATHPQAQLLQKAMAAAQPAWWQGWEVDPDADVVLVYEGDRPVAGAVLTLLDRRSGVASRFCAAPEPHRAEAGSALLDVLEAVALDRGWSRLRLDSSAFLVATHVPYLEHGYRVGPEYHGDPDEPVWAERTLRSTDPVRA